MPVPDLDPRRWRALALLAVAQFVVVLDASIMNIALPSIGREFGIGTDALAWVINAYVLAFGGLLLLGGRVADLIGRRRVFISGLLVFAGASLAGGLAASGGQLIAARAVQGMGAAALAPAALSIVTSLFPEGSERNRALGIWGAVAGSGGVAGVLLGGVLTSGLGWEWVLFVNVPIGLLAAALAPRLFDETDGGLVSRRFDLLGALTITASLTVAVYALVRADVVGWASTQTVGLLSLALLLAVVFVLAERRVAAPLVPPATFALRSLRAANLTMLAAGGAMFGLFFILSLFLQDVLGYTALEAGLSQLPLAGTLVLTAAAVPPLIERLGTRAVLVGGLGIFSIGLGWFSLMPADASFLGDILGPSLVVGIGLALGFVTLTIAAVAGVGDRDYGLASGLINTAQQVGGALGLAILVPIANSRIVSLAAGRPPTEAVIGEGLQSALLGTAALGVVATMIAALTLRRVMSAPSRTASDRREETKGGESSRD